MITTNVYQRTFRIKWGDSVGTAFTLDIESKQYLVTARHVVEGIVSGDHINISHDKRWMDIAVKVVGMSDEETDVAVLSCPIQLSPPHPLDADMAGLVYGQQVYFLGFPFGWDSGQEALNRGFPLPFVKSGILSAMPSKDPMEKIYVAAHGNKGFSGGPVVFVPSGQRPGPNTKLRVAGIVVETPLPPNENSYTPVVDRKGKPIVDHKNEPIGYIRENPGLVVAVGIRHATDLIATNPIGHPVP